MGWQDLLTALTTHPGLSSSDQSRWSSPKSYSREYAAMSDENPFEVSADAYGDRSGYDRGTVTAEVSTRTIELLNQTRPWVSLIGVLTWIGTALIILGILVSAGMGLAMGDPGMLLVSVLYLIMALIYGYVAKSLTGYAKRISRLNVSERVEDLEDALEAQKNFWKVIGIITLVVIIIYVGALLLMLAGVTFLGNLGRF